MDKLDSYGDNFRNIPICVPNETDKDAQIFKEKIANKNINSYSYFSESGLLSNDNSQSSISNFSIPMTENSLSWKRNVLESGDDLNSILSHGRKKAKKGKKEKKEPKKWVLYIKHRYIWGIHFNTKFEESAKIDNFFSVQTLWGDHERRTKKRKK